MQRRELPPNPVSDIRVEEVSAGTSFKSARVRTLYEWWLAEVDRQGRLPNWQDFDIIEHRALAPYLFIVETPITGDYRFRLLGESVIEMIGRNNVGELVYSRPDNDYGHALYDYYKDIVNRRVCLRCRGMLDVDGLEPRRFESIDCPVIDGEGQVTRIIGVMDYVSD